MRRMQNSETVDSCSGFTHLEALNLGSASCVLLGPPVVRNVLETQQRMLALEC